MDPYRVEADMPVCETKEQKAAREREARRSKEMKWIVGACALPVGGILTIGAEWAAMRTAMATCSIVALTVATLGTVILGVSACEK